jgi:hypothetical protein
MKLKNVAIAVNLDFLPVPVYHILSVVHPSIDHIDTFFG